MKGTDEIRTYSFDNDGLNELKSFEYGKNWPVVYLIHNNKDLYIGETTSAEVRMSQHLSNNEKNYLEEIAIVFDHKFNKSVILDYEQRLIKYCSVDSRFQNILNKNKGQQANVIKLRNGIFEGNTKNVLPFFCRKFEFFC